MISRIKLLFEDLLFRGNGSLRVSIQEAEEGRVGEEEEVGTKVALFKRGVATFMILSVVMGITVYWIWMSHLEKKWAVEFMKLENEKKVVDVIMMLGKRKH